MPLRVLITSSRGKEHLVKAFEETGAKLVYHLANADLIIPTVDEELPFFSQNTLFFEGLKKKIMISSDYTINMVRDKSEFYRFCKRHGFLTPDTLWPQDGVVIKPRFGKGSRGVIKIDKSFIIQENLSEFPEVSVDYFADWQGIPLSIIPRYRKNVVNGESTEAEFLEHIDLTEVTRLGKELMIIGHAVIQGFWTGKNIVFTEVNPRFGGGSWLTFTKFHSPKWLVEHTYE